MIYIANAEPPIKHFYIEENKQRCALLDLSSDITVNYETITGNNTVTLNMAKTTNDQAGKCSLHASQTQVQINITLSPSENLIFAFTNVSDSVELTSIEFQYSTPNLDFPDAKKNKTVHGVANPNLKLSGADKFYLCNSSMHFQLTNSITVNVYKMKVKVFNVVNDSFGQDMEECGQDFITSTTLDTTPTTKQTTPASTKDSTTTASTTHEITTGHEITTTHEITTGHEITTTHEITTSGITTKTNVVTTSIAPTPKPSPSSDYLFRVKDDKTGYICLLMQSQLNVTIKYYSESNTIVEAPFSISNSSYNGTCSETDDKITIQYGSVLSIEMIFKNSSGYSVISNISLTYHLDPVMFPKCLYPNKVVTETKSPSVDGKTDLASSYSCNNITVDLGNTSTLVLTGFKYEAFRKSDKTDFIGKETTCEAAKSSLVAIIVGVILAAFLIVVVILFLVFRYRANKRKGYEEI